MAVEAAGGRRRIWHGRHSALPTAAGVTKAARMRRRPTVNRIAMHAIMRYSARM